MEINIGGLVFVLVLSFTALYLDQQFMRGHK